jgi:delta 1-pyrroline-5-carboxylate dehydrogenase
MCCVSYLIADTDRYPRLFSAVYFKGGILSMSKQFIDGKFVESHSNETIEVLNPANNKLIGEVAKGNEQDVKDAVAGAVQAQKSWAAIKRVKRAEILCCS